MFFDNLKKNYEKLSITEQQVIDYLMKENNIENITLKTIKHDIYISSSTVIRACKKLGYNTYNDLKYDLRLEKEIDNIKSTKNVTSFSSMKEQLTSEFLRTMAILDNKDFDNFAEIIINSRRVFCLGIGSSYMPMTDFNRKLKLINIWSNDFFEQFSIERIPEISTSKDTIIVFSLGGNNNEINNSLLKAKKNGTCVLAITSLNGNNLNKIADYSIKVYDAVKSREKIRSRLMLNLVGTLLFETIINKINSKSK